MSDWLGVCMCEHEARRPRRRVRVGVGGLAGAEAPTNAEKWKLTQTSQALWSGAQSQTAPTVLRSLAANAQQQLARVDQLQAWEEAGTIEAKVWGPWDSTTQVKQRLREVIRVASAKAAGETPAARAAPTSRLNVNEEAARLAPTEVQRRAGELYTEASSTLSSPWTWLGVGGAILAGIAAYSAARRR